MAQTKRSIKPFNIFKNLTGQNEDTGIMFIKPDSAELIENMHLDKTGQWSANNQGYDNFVEFNDTAIDNLGYFKNSSNEEFLIVKGPNQLRAYAVSSGSLDTTIKSYSPAVGQGDMAVFKSNLYIVQSGLRPQKWDGTAASGSNATGWPLVSGADTYTDPMVCSVFANRMAFANFTNYPSYLILSDDLNAESFTIGVAATNAAILPVSPGDGQKITGLKVLSNPSTADQTLVIFRDKSIYGLDGHTPGTFYLYQINGEFGAVNQKSIVQVGNDLLFIGRDNIYSLRTSAQSGTLQPIALGSQKIKDTFAEIDLASLANCWSAHLPLREEVWFNIPTSSTENKILVYNYRQDGNQAWSVRTNTADGCAVVIDNDLYTGMENSEFVHKWFNSSSYNGTGINWTYTYPFYNFDTQNQNKRVVDLYLWMFLGRTTTFTFSYTWRNGGNESTKTYSKTIDLADSTESIWGSFVWGTGSYGGGDDGVLVKIKLPVYGNGEQLQLSFTGTTETLGPVFVGGSGLVEYMGFDRSYR